MPTATITAPPTTDPPRELAAALTEMHRRHAAAAATGQTCSDEPSIVVIHNATEGLQDAVVRAAVLQLAMLGARVNMSVELRGEGQPQPPQTWTTEPFGGSIQLRDAALGPQPNVYYRRLLPLRTYPLRKLCLWTTRVVHADPERLARGRTDTGIFCSLHTDPTWTLVLFDGDLDPTLVLTADLSVETPTDPGQPEQ